MHRGDECPLGATTKTSSSHLSASFVKRSEKWNVSYRVYLDALAEGNEIIEFIVINADKNRASWCEEFL